jgi:hypothetical protein
LAARAVGRRRRRRAVVAHKMRERATA